jgi:malonate-semialdehyde dehydrogenase (acetylating)/methylmalonate-semialdehyde dehydrogenase
VAVLVGDVADQRDARSWRNAPGTLKVQGRHANLDAEMGPIVTAAAHARITGYIEQGVKEGAMLLVDGRSFQGASA